jgi:copper chaperone
MIRLDVPEMSCGHCKASVEKAVRGLDAQAMVAVDLATRQVEITTAVPQAAVVAALQAAGFESRPAA